MPKSTVSKKKLFRDFSHLDQRYINHNHLKNLRTRIDECLEKNDIFEKELMFMLWAYDLEFFTLDYASQEYGVVKRHMGDRYIFPMVKADLLYKHFDRLTPSQTREDHLFREENKYKYRVRYALTQRARLMVQRFYNSLGSVD